jgi:hypothetical protein
MFRGQLPTIIQAIAGGRPRIEVVFNTVNLVLLSIIGIVGRIIQQYIILFIYMLHKEKQTKGEVRRVQ